MSRGALAARPTCVGGLPAWRRARWQRGHGARAAQARAAAAEPAVHRHIMVHAPLAQLLDHNSRVRTPQGVYSQAVRKHAACEHWACLRASAPACGSTYPFSVGPASGIWFAFSPPKWPAPAAVPTAWPAAADRGGAAVPNGFLAGRRRNQKTALMLNRECKRRFPSALALQATPWLTHHATMRGQRLLSFSFSSSKLHHRRACCSQVCASPVQQLPVPEQAQNNGTQEK
jgi:hypothetical protein